MALLATLKFFVLFVASLFTILSVSHIVVRIDANGVGEIVEAVNNVATFAKLVGSAVKQIGASAHALTTRAAHFFGFFKTIDPRYWIEYNKHDAQECLNNNIYPPDNEPGITEQQKAAITICKTPADTLINNKEKGFKKTPFKDPNLIKNEDVKKQVIEEIKSDKSNVNEKDLVQAKKKKVLKPGSNDGFLYSGPTPGDLWEYVKDVPNLAAAADQTSWVLDNMVEWAATPWNYGAGSNDYSAVLKEECTVPTKRKYSNESHPTTFEVAVDTARYYTHSLVYFSRNAAGKNSTNTTKSDDKQSSDFWNWLETPGRIAWWLFKLFLQFLASFMSLTGNFVTAALLGFIVFLILSYRMPEWLAATIALILFDRVALTCLGLYYGVREVFGTFGFYWEAEIVESIKKRFPNFKNGTIDPTYSVLIFEFLKTAKILSGLRWVGGMILYLPFLIMDRISRVWNSEGLIESFWNMIGEWKKKFQTSAGKAGAAIQDKISETKKTVAVTFNSVTSSKQNNQQQTNQQQNAQQQKDQQQPSATPSNTPAPSSSQQTTSTTSPETTAQQGGSGRQGRETGKKTNFNSNKKKTASMNPNKNKDEKTGQQENSDSSSPPSGLCHMNTTIHMLTKAAHFLKRFVSSDDVNSFLKEKFDVLREDLADAIECPLDGSPQDSWNLVNDSLSLLTGGKNKAGEHHHWHHYLHLTPTSKNPQVPEGAEIIGAARHVERPDGTGHWSFVEKKNGGWFEIDGGSEPKLIPFNENRPLLGENVHMFYMYVHNAPCVGNGVKFDCAGCGTGVHQHREPHVNRTCMKCGDRLVGACTGIGKKNRDKKVENEIDPEERKNFVCKKCRETQKKEKQQKEAEKQNSKKEKKQQQQQQQKKQENENVSSELCVQCNESLELHDDKTKRTCEKCSKSAFGKCGESNNIANILKNMFSSSTSFICSGCSSGNKNDNNNMDQQQPSADKEQTSSSSSPSTNQNQHKKENQNAEKKNDQQSAQKKSNQKKNKNAKKNENELTAEQRAEVIRETMRRTPPSRPPPTYNSGHHYDAPVNDRTALEIQQAQQETDANAPEVPADFKQKETLGEAPVLVSAEELADAPPNAMLNNQEEVDFQGRLSSPPAPAVYKGEFLDNVIINKSVPKELANARHPQTFQNHFRCLKYLVQMYRHSSTGWKEVPLVKIAVRALILRCRHREWKPQTLFREACSMQGAMAGLAIYTNQKFGVLFKDDPYWKHMMAIWRLASQQNQPQNQTVVTPESILQAVSATDPTDARTKVALILQWYLAARAGDVLKLRKKDVVLERKKDVVNIQVTFRHAKTVAKRGAYTVKSVIQEDLHETLKFYLDNLPNDEDAMIFPNQKGAPNSRSIAHQEMLMRHSLKGIDSALTTRSIRRGALQAMSKEGVDEATLMHFSGHKDRNTLLRYLDYGRNFSKEEKEARAAATHLRPQNQNETGSN